MESGRGRHLCLELMPEEAIPVQDEAGDGKDGAGYPLYGPNERFEKTGVSGGAQDAMGADDEGFSRESSLLATSGSLP